MTDPRPARPIFTKPFLLLNPVAGTTSAEDVRAAFERACERFGWSGQMHETAAEDDPVLIVREALQGGADLVLAAGGDGTVSAAASALVGSRVPLAIIPSGTANFLATDLGIPGDIDAAFAYLAAGAHDLLLDAMRIGERHYVLNVGVGLSSTIMKNTSREGKRRFGMLAYLWSGIRTLAGKQLHKFSLVVDGTALDIRAAEILICAGGLFGKLVNLQDVQVKPDDGVVDIFIIQARNLKDYLVLGYYLLIGRPRSSAKIIYLRAQDRVRIDARKPLLVEGDGDLLHETPVEIRVVPRAVRILVPDSTDQHSQGKISVLRKIIKIPESPA